MNSRIKGDIEVSNILIVESENDKFFIEALIAHIDVDIEVGNPICTIDEYDCMGGVGHLKNRLEALRSRFLKGDDIHHVGIIMDADSVGVTERKKQIVAIKDSIFKEDELNLKIFIINIDGKGELETLLKAIKSSDSTTADCLESWQECLGSEALSQKEFDKLWVQIYQRFDCCSPKERKQAGKKCSSEASLKNKSIYDFDKEIEELRSLRDFLEEFRGEE